MIITKHPKYLEPGDRFLYKWKVLTVGPGGVREYVRIPLFGGEFLALDAEASVDVLVPEPKIDPVNDIVDPADLACTD